MSLTKRLMFGFHRLATRFKLHVLPVHYYSPVVNLLELEATRSRWAKRSSLPGIVWDPAEQLETMRGICAPFLEEYRENRAFIDATTNQFGPGYGPIEAQALHAVVRHVKPKRIIEVGSGVSTACMRAAADLNDKERGGQTKMTCVEPYPSDRLKSLGEIELIVKPVQAVDPSVFEALGEGDLLFIDSSHAAKTGSDVNYLYLEVFPRLRPGLVIHVHDIYLPYDYSPLSLKTLWHWNETSLLRAWMTDNPKVRTLFCMSQMHHDFAEGMKELFPSYDPQPLADGLVGDEVGAMGYPTRHFPCSIYLKMTDAG